MGITRKILAKSDTRPISAFYSDLFGIELAENFHIHLRNFRMELDHNEFETLCKGFIAAYKAWTKNHKPNEQRYAYLKDQFLHLHSGTIQPIPGLWNNEITNDQIRVELQQWSDYIHVHHRNLRWEFTVDEFLELGRVIAGAVEELEDHLKTEDTPRRWGKYHRANPDNRVNGKTPTSTYWSSPEDQILLERPYATQYLDEGDAAAMETGGRPPANDSYIYLDIRDLYDITLYHSAHLTPYGVDENGVYQPLKARSEFVDLVTSKEALPTPEEIRNTLYWDLMNRPISESPRDGAPQWVYADPTDQTQRFLELIDSMREHGYLGTAPAEVHERFEGENGVRVIFDDGQHWLRPWDGDGTAQGLMTVRPCGGAYRVWNGLHRIAILKHFLDSGRLEDPRVLVKKWDGSTFGPDDFVVPTKRITRLKRMRRRLRKYLPSQTGSVLRKGLALLRRRKAGL